MSGSAQRGGKIKGERKQPVAKLAAAVVDDIVA